jgi:hypothetical protein
MTWPAMLLGQLKIGEGAMEKTVLIEKNALQDVKAWRASMGYTIEDACLLLEVKEDQYKAWENGARPVPRYIALACAALAMGIKV